MTDEKKMKKINWIFLSVVLAVGIFSVGVEKTEAASCCVKSSSCKVIPANYPGTNLQAYCNGQAGTGYTVTDCSQEACWAPIAAIQTSCCVKSVNTSSADYGKMSNCSTVNTAAAKASCPGKLYPQDCTVAKPAECYSASTGTGTGTTTPTTTTSIPFANPLQIETLPALLDSILKSLRGVIVVIAVIFIVIGGILYMTSAGNETMVKRAKQTWTGAVVGLAIALAAPAFLNEILAILQAGPDVAGTGSDVTIKSIAINTLNFLLSVFGVLAIIALVIGGGMYLTAYGDEKKIDSGKKIVTYAIIGIVVALSALVVVRQIANLVGVTP
jgi:TRAP-type C4-dicarboxylate transport system permease small subunit